MNARARLDSFWIDGIQTSEVSENFASLVSATANSSGTTSRWIALVVLAIFALALRVLLRWRTGFDGLYGQDPFAYLDYAATFKDALVHAQWPPSFFWPIGYPALAAALSTILPLSIATQAISIVSGVLIAVLTFLIVCEILGDRPHAVIAALFAGAIVASAGQLLISSLVAMSDAASLGWATLSAYGILRYRRTYAWPWIALAAFALGWAVTTRWVYALLIPVWGISLIAGQRNPFSLTTQSPKITGERETQPIFLGKTGFWRRYFPRKRVSGKDIVIASAFFLLAFAPQGALIAEAKSRDDAAFVGDASVYTWNPLNAFQSDIANTDGHFTYDWSVGNFYSLPLVEPDYIAIWFTPLIGLGIWALRKRRVELLLLLGWFAVMWGFLIGVEWENWRFPLAFFPPLAVLAGVGFGELLQRISAKRVVLVGSWLGLGLIVACAWGWYDAGAFIGRQLDERSIVGWLDARVPADATVLTFGETATLQHFTPFRVFEMADESPDSVEQIARGSKDVFVLLNVENIEAQWQGLPPQVNFQTLQDHFALRMLASRGAYVLFAVEGRP